jgi:hypothetical protein
MVEEIEVAPHNVGGLHWMSFCKEETVLSTSFFLWQ